MGRHEEVKNLTVGVVASYDERICAVGDIIEKSLEMLDQHRQAEQTVQSELRETLAKVESLRKKDFDCLMGPILDHQEKREKEIKQFLNDFLKRQRELAGQLKRLIQAGILSQVPEVERSIEEAIEEAKQHLLCFQKEQALIWKKMQALFQKKEELTLKEFKKTLDILQTELGLNNKMEQLSVKGGELYGTR